MAAKDNEKSNQIDSPKSTSTQIAPKTLVFGQKNKLALHKANGNTKSTKAVGWMKDSKFLYSDQCVQDLVKQCEVPGVGGAQGIKSIGADVSKPKRPQHKAKIQFKPNEKLIKEALKVNAYLQRVIVRMKDAKGAKQQAEKSNAADGAQPGTDAKDNPVNDEKNSAKASTSNEEKDKGKT